MTRDFKTILCPTDFSDHANLVMEYGLRFAKISDGTILLVHIIHMPTEEYRDDKGQVLRFEDMKTRDRARLEEARATHLDGYPKTELIVELGDPREELIKIATRRNVDLIVTSTRGLGNIDHLILGSVAEKIIRHAPCPVFVVRQAAS